jgi:hypothetical protein
LRKRRILGFLFSGCVLILGCKIRQAESLSITSDAPTGFEVGQGMSMFYGNFDPVSQTSTVAYSSADSAMHGRESMTARPLFHKLIVEPGGQRFVLLTYAVPKRDEKYDCHACAPTLGMAVFNKKGSTWILSAANRAITNAGGYGKPPTDIELVEIGTNRYAVQIKDVDTGGESTAVILILAPWNDTVNLALERIIGDDDKGMCEPKGLPCYANHRTVNFSHNANADYFDLELKLTGTDLPISDAPRAWLARKVSGLELLKFEDGKYIQVSRSGDLTTVDRVVAGREGLK